ncbi:acylphosphatase-2-like [Rhodnius prolixus]|uniref:Acylphosphatase n=1 Tax=Rhodnius prolixus TaxID=13249 RepID=T1IEM1_RHOPR
MTSEFARNSLISLRFEVFGKVQGVFFRKYTRDKAIKLGLKGFVQNTESGTVIGMVEGNRDKVDEMKEWLTKTGSPSSKVDKCVFSQEKKIEQSQYKDFSIHR